MELNYGEIAAVSAQNRAGLSQAVPCGNNRPVRVFFTSSNLALSSQHIHPSRNLARSRRTVRLTRRMAGRLNTPL